MSILIQSNLKLHKKLNLLILKTLQLTNIPYKNTKHYNTLSFIINHKSNKYLNNTYTNYSYLYSLNSKQLKNLHKLLKLLLKNHFITKFTYKNITSQSEELLFNYNY